MKILSVNNTNMGGAAVVAKRLNKQLINYGIDVETLNVGDTGYDKFIKMMNIAEQVIWPIFMKTKNNIYHSPAVFSKGIEKVVSNISPDIVHLHWINGGLMKPEDLLKINKPIVWTMHDMWTFCGAEHHAEDNRFINGYRSDNRPKDEIGIDINKWVWNRKKAVYRKIDHIYFVAPSKWLYELAIDSYLLKDKKVIYIPNGIDLKVFFPEDKNKAKISLGFSGNKKILLLGSAFISGDKNKQNEFIFKLLKNIMDLKDKFVLVTLGSGDDTFIKKISDEYGVQTKHLGFVKDEIKLKDIYNAADLFLMFSKHENMPTMLIESMACGTPGIAFSVGGIPEIIENDKLGFLIKPFDINEYERKLRDFILSKNTFDQSDLAKTIEVKYDIVKTKKMYVEVFNSLMKSDKLKVRKNT